MIIFTAAIPSLSTPCLPYNMDAARMYSLFHMLPLHLNAELLPMFPMKGLKNVFDEAILAALEPPEPKKSRRCVLL